MVAAIAALPLLSARVRAEDAPGKKMTAAQWRLLPSVFIPVEAPLGVQCGYTALSTTGSPPIRRHLVTRTSPTTVVVEEVEVTEERPRDLICAPFGGRYW